MVHIQLAAVFGHLEARVRQDLAARMFLELLLSMHLAPRADAKADRPIPSLVVEQRSALIIQVDRRAHGSHHARVEAARDDPRTRHAGGAL